MKSGIVTEVTTKRTLDDGLSELIVVIDHLDSYYLYDYYNAVLPLIGQPVTFYVRPDYINGIKENVICNIVRKEVIQTAESTMVNNVGNELDNLVSTIPDSKHLSNICSLYSSNGASKSESDIA